MGNENMTASPSGTFRTGHGLLNIAANQQQQFETLCRLIGREDARDRYALCRPRGPQAPQRSSSTRRSRRRSPRKLRRRMGGAAERARRASRRGARRARRCSSIRRSSGAGCCRRSTKCRTSTAPCQRGARGLSPGKRRSGAARCRRLRSALIPRPCSQSLASRARDRRACARAGDLSRSSARSNGARKGAMAVTADPTKTPEDWWSTSIIDMKPGSDPLSRLRDRGPDRARQLRRR